MSSSINTTQQKKKLFIEAYKNNMCIISTAAEEVGIDRTTYYGWMKNDPEFKKSIDEAEPLQVEFVENALLKRIKEGSDTSIQFYLKTKGKKYGYGTQVDITTNGEAINQITVIKLTEIKKDIEDDKID